MGTDVVFGGQDDDERIEWQLAEWKRDMEVRRLAPKTIRERVRLVRHLHSSLGVADGFTVEQLREFLSGLAGRAAATTQFNYHVIIRLWSQWLVERDVRPDDPSVALGTPRLPKRRPRPARTAHLELVLAHANLEPQTVMKVLLAAYQGLRCIEIARMRGEYVDVAAMKIRVLGKGNTDVESGLSPVVANYVARYPEYFGRRGWWFPSPVNEGRHVLPGSVSRVLSAFRRVGAPVTAHQLRHWTATELIREGIPTRVVQKVMRHASIQTTEGYTEVADDSTAHAIRQLPRVQV